MNETIGWMDYQDLREFILKVLAEEKAKEKAPPVKERPVEQECPPDCWCNVT